MDTSILREWNGADSIEELIQFFDALCSTYRQASAEERAAIRVAVRRNQNLYCALLHDSNAAVGNGSYLTALASGAQRVGIASYLEQSLTVASMTGGFGDSRDTLLWLDSLWDGAEKYGVDPEPYFRTAADLSDATEDRDPMYGGSLKGLILQVARYSPRTGKR